MDKTSDKLDEMDHNEHQNHPVMLRHWSDPETEDHTSSKVPIITCKMSTPAPELSHPVADSILEWNPSYTVYRDYPNDLNET